jgi:Asparaginase
VFITSSGIVNSIAVANAVRKASLEHDEFRVRATCLVGKPAFDFALKNDLPVYSNASMVSTYGRQMCDLWRQRLGLFPIDWQAEEENLKPFTSSTTTKKSSSVPPDSNTVYDVAPPKHIDKLSRTFSPTTSNFAELHGIRSNDGEYDIQDTVGVIVMDKDGNFACGCSSGGPGLKDPGRLGPAAIQGAGGAMNLHYYSGLKTAVLASGSGELIRATMASSVASERLFYGQSVDEKMRMGHCPEDAILPLYIRNEFLSK